MLVNSMFAQFYNAPCYKFPQTIAGIEIVESKQQIREFLDQAYKNFMGDPKATIRKIFICQYTQNLLVKCLQQNCKWRLTYSQYRIVTNNQIKKEYSNFVPKSPRQDRLKQLLIQQKSGHKLLKFNLIHNHRKIKYIHKNLQYAQKFKADQKIQLKNMLCQSLHDVHINPKFIKPIMSSFINIEPYQRFMHYNPQLCLRYSNKYTFLSWYEKAKSKNYHIITYPLVQDYNRYDLNFKAPDFIYVTTEKGRKKCKQKAQVIGIKISHDKIIQKTSNYCQYAQIIFYEIQANGKNHIYMIGFYPEGNILTKKNKQSHQKYHFDAESNKQQIPKHDKLYNQDNGNPQPLKQQLQIDINLYKVLRVFLKTMGEQVRTFIIEDIQIQINTMEYLIEQLERTKTYPYQLNYLISPNLFINREIPESMHQVAHKLLTSKSQQKYHHLYQSIAKNYTPEQYEVIKKIHQNRHKYLIFFKGQSIFLSGWVDWNLEFKSLFLDNDVQFRRNLTYLLVLSCVGLKNQERFEMKTQTAQMPFENIRIERLYKDEKFVEVCRESMHKRGFRELMKQLDKSSQVSFIYDHTKKTLIKKAYKELPFQQNNLNDLREYFRDNKGLKNFIPYRMKQPIQTMYQDYENARYYNTYVSTDIKEKEKYFYVGQPFMKHYKRAIEQLNPNQQKNLTQVKRQSNKKKISVDSSDEEQLSDIVNEEKSVPLHKSLIDVRMASYQQLYPITPITQIKHVNILPPYFKLLEHGEVFFCVQKVIPSQKQPFFTCSCNYFSLQGLPCRHILKICLTYKLKIDQYIHNYWKTSKTLYEYRQVIFGSKGLEVPAKGRPKMTRRNQSNLLKT